VTTLSACIPDEQIFDYNRRKGMSSYIDPVTKLLCVTYDNSPTMGYYYDYIDSISNAEQNDLLADNYNFGSQLSADVSTSATSYYEVNIKNLTNFEGWGCYDSIWN
jgi:hypothetical protein